MALNPPAPVDSAESDDDSTSMSGTEAGVAKREQALVPSMGEVVSPRASRQPWPPLAEDRSAVFLRGYLETMEAYLDLVEQGIRARQQFSYSSEQAPSPEAIRDLRDKLDLGNRRTMHLVAAIPLSGVTTLPPPMVGGAAVSYSASEVIANVIGFHGEPRQYLSRDQARSALLQAIGAYEDLAARRRSTLRNPLRWLGPAARWLLRLPVSVAIAAGLDPVQARETTWLRVVQVIWSGVLAIVTLAGTTLGLLVTLQKLGGLSAILELFNRVGA